MGKKTSNIIFKFKKLMTVNEISNCRISNQKIVGSAFKTAKELVGWMGAMQAQDFSMAKLAIGIRVLNSTEEKIESAFNNAEILRTHVLRPTWHFIPAEDIYWMLDLTARRIKSSMTSRLKQLELTPELITKSNSIIETVFSKTKFLTREELATEFNNANINVADNRLSHLLFQAELEGIVCSGPIKAKKQTYALLYDRVPNKKIITRDEALAELAKRYFTSHCPATLKDFIWWSGLSAIEAGQALELIKPTLISETINSEKYWMTSSFSECKNNTSVHFLPAFDEFLISYRDRSASLSLTDNKKAVSDNGIFRPVIVLNGQVIGLWKRTLKKDKIMIETGFFQKQDKGTKVLVEISALFLNHFYGKTLDLIY